MSIPKAAFITVPTDKTNGKQTHPVSPTARVPNNSISLSLCTPADAPRIAHLTYTCFPASGWDALEPLSIRDPDQAAREHRLATRLLPSFHLPYMKWVKAVYEPTGEMVGVAGWCAPGMPVHNIVRRSAVEFYGFKEIMGWSDAEVEEMWKGVDISAWDKQFGDCDKIRAEVMGDEPHWFLAPLLTWPEFQGRGVGSMLLKWAMAQADGTDPPTPMYLESSKTARAVYLHHGWVPCGEVNMVRRGLVVAKDLESGKGNEGREVEQVDMQSIEKEVEGARAS
jgi:GNAT superfamily N-acetyltransferase